MVGVVQDPAEEPLLTTM